jgi:hypothetical protein
MTRACGGSRSNPDYSQAEGRGYLFNGPQQKPDEPYHWRLQR